jgi:methylmalonyl-CoA mutase
MIFEQAVKEQSWVEEGKIKLIGVNLYPKLEVKKQLMNFIILMKSKSSFGRNV